MKTISLTQGQLAIVDDEDYETIVSLPDFMTTYEIRQVVLVDVVDIP